MLRVLFSTLLACTLLPYQGLTQNLSTVKSWAYQLQNIDIATLAAAPYDLLVIDYSADGSDATAFQPADLTTLKDSGKKVLAYFSIGEAEDYRFYFKPSQWLISKDNANCGVILSPKAPLWLDRPNPNWCGNYKARYWKPGWRKILFGKQSGSKKSYLDRIIDNGFDGVYLDIIDAFEYGRFRKELGGKKKTALKMANLVIDLATYARAKHGDDFIVVPQNGAHILQLISPTKQTAYLAAINAIGAEDTFFYGDADENNDYNPQDEVIEALQPFLTAGKIVLSIDYLTDTSKITQFQTTACEHGYIPQVSNRALDTVSTHSTFECP
jgi:cysteinyl-tRNA synthetase